LAERNLNLNPFPS